MSRIALLFLLVSGCTSQSDKASHIVVGRGFSAAVTQATGDPWAGCAATIALGIGKELYDSTGRGTPEALDAIATGVGGCSFSFAF